MFCDFTDSKSFTNDFTVILLILVEKKKKLNINNRNHVWTSSLLLVLVLMNLWTRFHRELFVWNSVCVFSYWLY